MSHVKPFKIIIEWSNPENFNFSCDYAPPDVERNRNSLFVGEAQMFPFMARAMSNVLKKLRKEQISFPLFLVALAFNHSNLLHEIDQLLHLLHLHIKEKQVAGTFSCNISSSNQKYPSSSL
jgi:hypothetical protein